MEVAYHGKHICRGGDPRYARRWSPVGQDWAAARAGWSRTHERAPACDPVLPDGGREPATGLARCRRAGGGCGRCERCGGCLNRRTVSRRGAFDGSGLGGHDRDGDIRGADPLRGAGGDRTDGMGHDPGYHDRVRRSLCRPAFGPDARDGSTQASFV